MIILCKRSLTDESSFFIKDIHYQYLLQRIDQPIFRNARFLVHIKLIGHFGLGVAGRQDFDNKVRSTVASFFIEFVRIAHYTEIWLNDGIRLISLWDRQTNIKRCREKLTGTILEVKPKQAVEVTSDPLVLSTGSGTHFDQATTDKFYPFLKCPGKVISKGILLRGIELVKTGDDHLLRLWKNTTNKTAKQ